MAAAALKPGEAGYRTALILSCVFFMVCSAGRLVVTAAESRYENSTLHTEARPPRAVRPHERPWLSSASISDTLLAVAAANSTDCQSFS